MRKKLTMFVTGFTVMLVAGAATAQIGIWDVPDVDLFASDRHAGPIAAPEAEAEDHEAVPATTQADPPTQTGAYGWASELAATEKATTENVKEETQAEEAHVVSPDPIEKTGTEGTKEKPADTTPPDIVILAPKDGQVFEQSKVAYEGKTEPGARVFAGSYEADVDADGNWRIVLVLSPGANRATFTAMDAAGNTSSAMVSAVYEPPVEKKDVAGFFAENVYGSCVESPPFDVYHGKGEPGSTVFVVSEYGSGQTTVGAEGGWELRVEFPGAPPGKVFAVKVKDSLGRSTIFEFVYAPK